jgi:hypothetical protein
MAAPASIDEKKKLFHLPFVEDELEYWGPLNHVFCNSFLTMANSFFEKFLEGKDIKFVKAVFSSFVELVQNISEYNEQNLVPNIPPSYVNVSVKEDFVMIKTANQILLKDVDPMIKRMQDLDASTPEDLKEQYKYALLNNQSLGLIMIKKMSNAKLDWEINQQNDTHWLLVELKIEYGKA